MPLADFAFESNAEAIRLMRARSLSPAPVSLGAFNTLPRRGQDLLPQRVQLGNVWTRLAKPFLVADMSLHLMTDKAITPVNRVRFSEAGIRERGDLQRLLKEAISIVSPNTLVLAEEFSDWEDSRRRIDLLGLDKEGNLVVIELKRTEDGGHMDLQAIRYAAMVSGLTFDRIVEIYSKTLAPNKKQEDALFEILGHLGWSSPEDGQIATNVRIVLVAADFSKEITTSVLWLNDQGLDVSCIRLVAYNHNDPTLLDVKQVIPLPEAADYMVRLREKSQEVRANLRERCRSYDKYDVTTGLKKFTSLPKSRAIFEMVRYLAVDKCMAPSDLQAAIGQQRARFYRVLGEMITKDEFLTKAAISADVNEGKSFDPVRWFVADNELIRHAGYTYVFSNQWGQWTEACMLRLKEAYAGTGLDFQRADDASPE